MASGDVDLERGPPLGGGYKPSLAHPNNSTHSFDAASGIGAALSSNGTSIMGSVNEQPVPGEEWGPQHPCYPHLNPHVPLNSVEYRTTRIIRIRRDWMLYGDLAPAFSNCYPEILDPAGLSEGDFRDVIDRLNEELGKCFEPFGWRAVVDGCMGLLTGWLWDDIGAVGVKSRLRKLEAEIEEWNRTKGGWREGEGKGVRIIPLRRTGYMNLDIQIPDPEIAFPAPSTSHSNYPIENERPRMEPK